MVRKALVSMLALGMTSGVALADAQKLTLLTFNMWGAGANAKKGIEETVAVLKASGADVIAVQETVPEPDPCEADDCKAGDASRLKDLAAALGYQYHEFKHNTDNHWADGVLTKYKFGAETPNGAGVEIDVNSRKIIVYSMNLDDSPYQPYQLLSIEYGKAPFLKTAKEAIASAAETRGKALKLLSEDVAASSKADAQFVMGDFNEPSLRDWTEGAVKAQHQPMAVEWPFTKGLELQGFVDTFRSIYPDEVARPAFTWTPTSEPTAKDDHHDRIDFIFAKGTGLKVTSAGIVGEKSPEADLVVTPWPSDHRASMAVVEFGG